MKKLGWRWGCWCWWGLGPWWSLEALVGLRCQVALLCHGTCWVHPAMGEQAVGMAAGTQDMCMVLGRAHWCSNPSLSKEISMGAVLSHEASILLAEMCFCV